MVLDKVFIGFTNDGIERVLYKTVGYYDVDLAYTKYVDLETKESFDFSQIDKDSLMPFKRVFGIERKRMRKRKVVKAYKGDRSKMYPLERLIYGDVCKIVKRKGLAYKYEIPIDKKVLLLKVEDNKYVNFKNIKAYEDVAEPLIVRREQGLRHGGSMTKKLILEESYRGNLERR